MNNETLSFNEFKKFVSSIDLPSSNRSDILAHLYSLQSLLRNINKSVLGYNVENDIIFTVNKQKSFELVRRVSKFGGLKHETNAIKYFVRAISDFKRKKRFHRFVKYDDFKLKGKAKKGFESLVLQFEDFRCDVLAMGFNKFYRLVSEFICVLNGTKYYPLNVIFSDEANVASEEFIHRMEVVMMWISDLIYREENKYIDSVKDFMHKLTIANKKIVVNVDFKSKDWYCISALQSFARAKGWSENDLLGKIKIFYKFRMKKIMPEMILLDLVHDEMDQLDSVTKSTKSTSIDTIKKQSWYKDWKAGIPK